MSGTFETSTPQIKKALRTKGLVLVEKVGNRVVDVAKPLIPSPGASRGYAVGALSVSGYVATETGGTTNYDKAVSRALGAPDNRLLKRDQIAPPTVPATYRGMVNAIVDYPITYASLIHDGFRHVGFDPPRWIMGTAFLTSAVNEVEDEWLGEWAALLKELEFITPITKAMRQADREERWRQSMLRAGRRDVRMSQVSFMEQMQSSGEKMERLRYGSGLRNIETIGEMWERLRLNADAARFGL
jgi:hypothetical protein